MGVGVSGVIILAQMEQRSRDRAIELLEPKWGEWNVTREVVLAEIEEFRQKGYLCGIRRSHGIESLTLSIPILNDTWTGLEAALSVLAPLNVLDPQMQDNTLTLMREAVARAEEVSGKIRKL